MALENKAAKVNAITPVTRFTEDERKIYWASLALRHCKGLGSRSVAKLLWRYGNAYNALDDAGSWPNFGIGQACVNEIKSGAWRKSAEVEWEKALKLNATVLLWNNPLFPSQLREIPDTPCLLYCQGDIRLLASPMVAVVGSRNATDQSKEMARYLGKALSQCGITVVSGMALGIDAMAHMGSLLSVGKSIGILGTGIDIHYPLANKSLFSRMTEEGLLLSEFGPGTPPGNYNFPVRNRLISGLSLGVVVVEAAARSGSLITAKLALEQNREVFAVPGPPMSDRSQGCQNLVKQGAHPVFKLDDILEVLADNLRAYKIEQAPSQPTAMNAQPMRPAPQKAPKAKPAPPLPEGISQKIVSDDNSQKILEILRANESMQMEDLMQATGMSAQELNSMLVIMEIQGRIKRFNGANFVAAE